VNARHVEIGSTVRVKFPSGEMMSFTITSSHHTDPSHGIISCDSPLGKALIGKKAGETISYAVENRIFEVTLVEICTAG